jgi:Fatty acid hydroxylase
MRYYKEFFGNGMIRFLLGVMLVSGTMAGFTYHGLSTWLSVASGIGMFGVFEYITHRYLLHQFPQLAPKMYAGHEAHHKDPNNDKHLFGPVHYDIIGYAVVFLTLLALSRNFSYTSAAVLGSSLLQLYYQWMHFVSHRPVKLWTPWGKWMKKKHLLHHHQDDHSWYGVSNPVLDYVMGSTQPKRKASLGENAGRGQSHSRHS